MAVPVPDVKNNERKSSNTTSEYESKEYRGAAGSEDVVDSSSKEKSECKSSTEQTHIIESEHPINMEVSISVAESHHEHQPIDVHPDTEGKNRELDDPADDIEEDDSSEPSDSSEFQDVSCRGKLKYCLRTIYASRFSVLLALFTITLVFVTVYLNVEEIDEEWLNIPIWRWTIYFALLFPSWAMTHYMLNALVFIAYKIEQCCSENPQTKRRIQDTLLFWQRYRFANEVFMWAILLTLIFGLVFAPIYEAHRDVSDISLDQWQSIYQTLLNIHIVFLIYALGSLIVEFIEFKYLTKFSVKNLTTKIDENIFQEAILLTLAGYNAKNKLLLLSQHIDEESLRSGHSQERRAHVVARYIRDNDLKYTLSVRMRLVSDKENNVVKALARKIKNNVRNTRNRQLRLIPNAKESKRKQQNDEFNGENQAGKKLNDHATVEGKSVNQGGIVDTWPNRSEKKETSAHEKIECENERHIGNVKTRPRTLQKANSDDHLIIRTFADDKTETKPAQSLRDFAGETYMLNASKSSGDSRRSAGRLKKKYLELILCNSALKELLDVGKAMEFIDPLQDDQDEFISSFILEETISKVLKDRQNLSWSLKDVATITAQIKSWVWWGMMMLVVFCSLLALGVRGVDTWVGFSTFIVGLSFIFGGAVKSAFENFIFLVGGHPFDVGDKIFLGGTKMYEVSRVSLQTTQLDHCGEVRVVQNSTVRNTEPLVNLSRSTMHWVCCSYLVDARLLSEEFLGNVKADMLTFVKKDQETYLQDFRIDSYEFVPPEKVTMSLLLTMRFSLENISRSRVAQSKAAVAFAQSLNRHGAKYTTVLEWSQNAG